MNETAKQKWILTLICLTAAIGGLLFGYDTGSISTSILLIKKELLLTTSEQELAIAMVPLGGILGAFFGGLLSDRKGRKKTILAASVIFIVGTFCFSFSDSIYEIIICRFVIGIAAGIYLAIVPLYIAELAPAHMRGALVSINQFAITIGLLASYLVGDLFIKSNDWRMIFILATIPAAFQFIVMLFFPESPSWLVNHGKSKEALLILSRYRESKEAELELLEIQKHKEKKGQVKQSHLKEFLGKPLRPILIAGIGITIIQQITGINAILYYAPTIFQFAGFASNQSAILATTLLGSVNVLMTFLSIFLLDRVGRKPLLIIGLSGMILSLLVLGIGFNSHDAIIGKISMISLLVYIAFFAISLGPIAWVLNSEIYPLHIRGSAIGLATCMNWFFNFLITVTFLDLTRALEKSGTFWLYAFIGILGLLFIIKKIPETKNKSLEEIEDYWKKNR
mgnify:CR=1 FL=1